MSLFYIWPTICENDKEKLGGNMESCRGWNVHAKMPRILTDTQFWLEKNIAVAGDRTRVTRVTGGNTYHYTTTT